MLSVCRSRSRLRSAQAATRRVVVTNGVKMADSWGELRTTHYRNCTCLSTSTSRIKQIQQSLRMLSKNLMNGTSGFRYRLLQDFTWSQLKRETRIRKEFAIFNRNADEFARIVPFALGVISDKVRHFLVSGGSPSHK